MRGQQVAAVPAPSVTSRILVDGAATALGGLARAANGLVLGTTPGRAEPDRPGGGLHVPDLLPSAITAVRVALTLLAVDLLWIETNWSGGQSLITFAAIGVLLFSPRLDAAYGIAAGWAIGTVISAALAAVIDFAVLPGQHSFAGFAFALGFVMIPFGALAARPWQQAAFTAVVANFLPLLAPANQPVYDPATFYNAALAIVAGTIVATVFLRLIPPLGAKRRTVRLLKLTLRDLRRLSVRRRWPDHAVWLDHVSHRLAALPAEASLEEAARLLAALSAGEAVITLRNGRARLADGEALDRALACLAAADLDGTWRALADFSTQQAETPAHAEREPMRARAAAAVISEALTRHAAFFASAQWAGL